MTAVVAGRVAGRARGLLVAFAVAAALVGAASALQPRVAAGVTVAAVLGMVVLRAPWSILALLLASIFVEIVTIGGFTLARVLAPLALAVVVAALIGGEARRPQGPVLGWIGVYSLWALSSSIWTVHFSGTTYFLGSLGIAIIYMLAFATLVRTADDLQRVFVALAFIALPVSVYAMATYFAGATMRSSGGKGDPNSFAAYELIALPLVVTAATSASNRRLRAALFATAVAIVGAAITSLSRGGLITLVTLVMLVAVVPARAVFRSRAQKALVLGVVVAGALLAFAATGSALTERVNSTFTTAGSAGSGRLDLWRGAVTSIRERPLLGLGYGTFPSVSTSLLLRTPGVDLEHFEPSLGGDLVHNAYLETLAELGIPGLVAFLGIVSATVHSLWVTARRARAAALTRFERQANALLLALAAWVVSALFLSLETARPLWTLIGLSLALRGMVTATEQRVMSRALDEHDEAGLTGNY